MLKEGYDMTADEAKEELEQVQSSIEKKDQNNHNQQQANGTSNKDINNYQNNNNIDYPNYNYKEANNNNNNNYIDTYNNHNTIYASEDPETGVIKSLPEVPLKTKIKRKFLAFVSLAFIETFTMIFLAEWGDRSQISTLILAARENVFAVTVGALLGHFLCTGLAVVGGRFIAQLISVKTGKFSIVIL